VEVRVDTDGNGKLVDFERDGRGAWVPHECVREVETVPKMTGRKNYGQKVTPELRLHMISFLRKLLQSAEPPTGAAALKAMNDSFETDIQEANFYPTYWTPAKLGVTKGNAGAGRTGSVEATPARIEPAAGPSVTERGSGATSDPRTAPAHGGPIEVRQPFFACVVDGAGVAHVAVAVRCPPRTALALIAAITDILADKGGDPWEAKCST
jgi:hypothetical protein